MLFQKFYSRYSSFIIALAIAHFFCATQLSAQTSSAAQYTPADDRIFIESAPIEELSTIIVKAYSALRGEAAQSELMVLGNMLQSKTGFNLFDPQQLSKAGIQIKKPFAMSFNKISPLTAKKPIVQPTPGKNEPNPWTMFIPAKDSFLLYRNLKTAFSKPAPAKLGQPQPPAPVIREIKQGRLFTVEKSDIYVARGKEFVTISNDQKRAMDSLSKIPQNLSGRKDFIAYRKHIAQFYEKSIPAFTFYVNNKGVQEDYVSKLLGMAEKLPAENPLLVESSAQLITSAGALFISREGMILHSDAIYNPGYLKDTTKLYPRLLGNPRVPTRADFCADGTAAYASFNFNVDAFKKLMEAINPQAMQQIYLSNQLLKSQKNTDLIGDIFDNATGSIVFMAPSLPSFQELEFIEKWNFSIHIGFKPEKRETINRTFSEFISLIASKSQENRYEKIQHAGKEYWSITTKKMIKKPLPTLETPSDKGDANSTPTPQFTMEEKTRITYVYIAESEAIISFNKGIVEKIIENKTDISSTQFPERMMGIKQEHLQNLNIAFYMRGDAMLNIIKDSPLMVFIAPAMPMLSKIHNLSFVSRHEGDTVFTEFRIKLRGNEVDL